MTEKSRIGNLVSKEMRRLFVKNSKVYSTKDIKNKLN